MNEEKPIKQKLPDPVYEVVDTELLKQEIEEFDFSNPPLDPVLLASDLHYTMARAGGYGLAANQCGLDHKLFVLNTEPAMTVFNPKITWYDDRHEVETEGCLSSPGMFVKIRRPAKIRARFQNEKGEMQTHVFEGMTARCFQHEYDHLHGIDFLDRASPINVKKAKDKLRKMKRKLKL